MLLFGDMPESTTAQIITSIAALVGAFTGLLAGIGALWVILQNRHIAKVASSERAVVKDELHAAVAKTEETAKIANQKLDVVVEQTNGINDKKFAAVEKKIETIKAEVKAVVDQGISQAIQMPPPK
jgi:hypothetical protein